MGSTNAPARCFLTGLATENIPSSRDVIEYAITFNGKRHFFNFDWDYANTAFINQNAHIIKGLIINELFPFQDKDFIYDALFIEKIIADFPVPKTPKSKLDHLMLHLKDQQKYDGDEFDLDFLNFMVEQLYFKNADELAFYLRTLQELNYITFTETIDDNFYDFKITFQGLEYLVSLEAEGEKSKNCFIAMSFSQEAGEIRNSIKNAVRQCGYEPIIMDEINYESDLTINDAMIGWIRKSKFLIADFTHQKHGVYFEAGFALGQNKPVIYTCHTNDFTTSHFDTSHYPHIVYDKSEDLLKKLIDKINAWII